MADLTWTTDKRKILASHIIDANKTGDVDKVPIYSDAAPKPLDVYNVPTEILSYNFDNVRISAEKAKTETDRSGKRLDPTDRADQEIVGEILYSSKFYSKTATQSLQEDIEKKGQIRPAVVTVDGVVWNGNRRLAIRRKMYKETGDQEYARVDIVVLPEMSGKELKQLERRLQMHRDLKEKYGPIQLRLDVRTSMNDPEWSPQEIIASYGGQYNERDLQNFKDEIDLIDDYLARIKRPNDYAWINEHEKSAGVESFVTLNNIVQKARAKNSSIMEIEKIKLAGFRLISHSDATYNTMRKLQKVLRDPQGREEFTANSVTFGDFHRGANLLDKDAISAEFDNVELAYETVSSSKKDAKKVAERALVILQGIKLENIPKNNDSFKGTLQQLADTINRLRSHAG